MQTCQQIQLAASLVEFQLPPEGLIQLSRFDADEVSRVPQEVWQAGQLRLSAWKQQLWYSHLRPRFTPEFWRAATEFALSDVLLRVWLGWLRTVTALELSVAASGRWANATQKPANASHEPATASHDPATASHEPATAAHEPAAASSQWAAGYENYWSDLEAVVDSLRQAHDDFRHRLLNRVATLGDWHAEGAFEFQRTARQAALWNDCLLAVLVADLPGDRPDIIELFHDPHRRGDWRLVEEGAADSAARMVLSVRHAAKQGTAPSETSWASLQSRWGAAVVRSLGWWDPAVRAHFPEAWLVRVIEGTEELSAWITAYDQAT